jgi:DNA-directed RNA polymerase beta' subunit
MKLNLLDIDKFIKEKRLKEVSNPIYFNLRNTPTEDGLFSYDIFGAIGSDERKMNYAYINLNGKFIHPMVYKVITSMGSKYSECISGNKYYVVRDGDLVEDPENGRTGLDFFYEAFDNIKFKETGSRTRTEKIELMEGLTKDQVFIDKYIVIPAYLRDFNPNKSDSSAGSDVDIINDKYVKIIRSAQSLNSGSFSFVTNSTKNTIQNTLVEIYELLTNSLALKNGIIHKSLMGKSVDYATRSVISAPRIKTNKWNDTVVPFGYTGVPLSQICVLFFPFFVKWISDFIDEYDDDMSLVHDAAGNEINLHSIKNQFTDKKIKDLIQDYIKNIEGRFNSLTVKDNKGKSYPVEIFRNDLKRNFTVIDLLYMAADDIISDKHVYITRYPMENFQNIFPSKIKIITTHETMEMKLGDKYLKEYPIVYPDYPTQQNFFVDSTIPNNSYLKALGGDYDGDTVSLRAVFTVEANKECDRLIQSKTMFLDNQGKSTRELKNESIQALYTLTSDPRM